MGTGFDHTARAYTLHQGVSNGIIMAKLAHKDVQANEVWEIKNGFR